MVDLRGIIVIVSFAISAALIYLTGIEERNKKNKK